MRVDIYYDFAVALLFREIHAYLLTRLICSMNNGFFYSHIESCTHTQCGYTGISVWPEQFTFCWLPVIDIGKKFLKMHILKVIIPDKLSYKSHNKRCK